MLGKLHAWRKRWDATPVVVEVVVVLVVVTVTWKVVMNFMKRKDELSLDVTAAVERKSV